MIFGYIQKKYMVKIILIRHCETEYNTENKYLGRTNVPLNNAGKNYAKLLAWQFKDENIRRIYSSNLGRTYETADIISAFHSLGVERVPGLNEIDFGDWEGLTFDEIERRYKKEAKEYLTDPLNFRFPNGETLQEFNKRILNAFNLILKRHLNEIILIVSHGGTNRIILGKALNLELEDHWRIKQDIGCINVIDFLEDTANVSLMNGTINFVKK